MNTVPEQYGSALRYTVALNCYVRRWRPTTHTTVTCVYQCSITNERLINFVKLILQVAVVWCWSKDSTMESLTGQFYVTAKPLI